MIRTFSASLAVLLLALAPAAAREFTDAEKADLATAVVDFNTAMTNQDWATVMGIVPPKILEKFATEAGITQEQLLEQMAALMEQSLATVTIDSFGMDLENVTYGETGDGTPYALIPTETVIGLGEQGKVKASSQTLGMFEEGEWYLVRTEDAATLAALKEIYPSYADLEVEPGTTEMITE
jgi:hypothetical protein